MTVQANSARGEAVFRVQDQAILMRPSFAAIIAAEDSLGPMLALAIAAGEGKVALSHIVELFAACAVAAGDGPCPTKDEIADLVVQAGLQAALEPYHALLSAILKGQSLEKPEAPAG